MNRPKDSRADSFLIFFLIFFLLHFYRQGPRCCYDKACFWPSYHCSPWYVINVTVDWAWKSKLRTYLAITVMVDCALKISCLSIQWCCASSFGVPIKILTTLSLTIFSSSKNINGITSENPLHCLWYTLFHVWRRFENFFIKFNEVERYTLGRKKASHKVKHPRLHSDRLLS